MKYGEGKHGQSHGVTDFNNCTRRKPRQSSGSGVRFPALVKRSPPTDTFLAVKCDFRRTTDRDNMRGTKIYRTPSELYLVQTTEDSAERQYSDHMRYRFRSSSAAPSCGLSYASATGDQSGLRHPESLGKLQRTHRLRPTSRFTTRAFNTALSSGVPASIPIRRHML